MRRDWKGFSPEPSISETCFDACRENDYFGKSTCIEYSIDDQKRHWHEIADALLREANTRKMAVPLTELNQASGDLQEAKMVLGRTRDRDSEREKVIQRNHKKSS